MTISITESQYSRLLAFAGDGALQVGEETEYLALRAAIDKASGITRYTLLVRYQAVPTAPAVVGRFEAYPAGATARIEQLRPVTRQDVDTVLENKETLPSLVLVTPDPQGIVGWCLLDDYNFATGG